MPRHTDPVQRREQVAEALFRVVASEGMQAATLPRIARELGATTGLVQTYFTSKDELLAFAFARLEELVRARAAAALQDAGSGVPDQLVAAMGVLACVDEHGEDVEGRVWLAFLARAVNSDRLHPLHAASAREVRDLCEQAFRTAQARGEISADLDPRAEAVALAAFADGLAVQRAMEPDRVTRQFARTLLRGYVDRLFISPNRAARES